MKTRLKNFTALLFAFLFLSSFAMAQELDGESAVRPANISWTELAEAHGLDEGLFAIDGNRNTNLTALQSATSDWGRLNMSALPEWKEEYWKLQLLFAEARDSRLYADPERPGFLRRAAWLYAIDGCFARASHISRVFESQGQPRPGKVFAFGDLAMQTGFERKTTVYWWYHVAAAFRRGREVIVLDPSADSQKPLLLREWVSRFAKRPDQVRVALCDTRAYKPSLLCLGGGEWQERNAVNHQRSFLSKEWNQVVAFRKDPYEVLGNNPPWKIRFPWIE